MSEPWRMPEPEDVTTRVERPWDDGRDTPEAVVALLAEEAVERLGLSSDVSARLQHRVVEDREALLRTAADEQAAYEERLAKHLPYARRAARGAAWWVGGRMAYFTGLAALWLGPFLFVWHAAGALGIGPWWRVPLLPLALVLLPLFRSDSEWAGWAFSVLGTVTTFGGIGAQFATWYVLPNGNFSGVSVLATMGYVLASGGLLVAGLFLSQEFHDGPTRVTAQRAFDLWVEALYGRGILPATAEATNDPGPVYDTYLTAPTRSYVDPRTAVDFDTAATAEVRWLSSRAKGSFALAGPRGSGKSTLMDLWCSGRFLPSRVPTLSVKVDAPVGYEPRDFLVHLFGRLCDAVERYAPAEPERKWWHRSAPERADDLGRLARAAREKIRHLESRTVEREVGADVSWLAAKVSGKRKTSVKRDDLPLTHPDLVDEFRSFLRTTAAAVGKDGGKVLIGVDELDRIDDGDRAARFLNELKAVFDVPHCLFLVSVSDDALADFELAGMGMRTAFDSAFDAVVRVDYLTHDEARTLLNRRVVNLPEQFAALAYVLSGGLARELVRVVEVIATHGGDLPTTARLLVDRQLARTARAATDRLTRLPDRRAGAKLIPLLDTTPTDLRTYAATLDATPVNAQAEPTKADVVAMVEFLATLTDLFTHTLDRPRTQAHPFNTLAQARRYLGANPYAARELIATATRTATA
ncbi:hypothetical protein [Actinokineospora globicatena]|uniref:hypothetical protein n=1 Tax=Actinokineospora globicatena TaxID=103729 RepID=UPI0020A391CA|nr:hypothetical protein [Actinokineospora globicatena]